MKETKLISMCEFVDMQSYTGILLEGAPFRRIKVYSRFLQTSLELKRFVTCDKDGNPISEPNWKDFVFEDHPELEGNPKEYDLDAHEKAHKEYDEALKDVWFVGFELLEGDGEGWRFQVNSKDCTSFFWLSENSNIEDMVEHVPMTDKILTPSKAKELGLIITAPKENNTKN